MTIRAADIILKQNELGAITKVIGLESDTLKPKDIPAGRLREELDSLDSWSVATQHVFSVES